MSETTGHEGLIREVARKYNIHSLIDGVLPLAGRRESVTGNAYFMSGNRFGSTTMNAGEIMQGGPLDVITFEHVFGYDGYYGHMLAQEVQILEPKLAALHLIARIVGVVEEEPEYYAFQRGYGLQTVLQTHRDDIPVTTMAISIFSHTPPQKFRYGHRTAIPTDLENVMALNAETIERLNGVLRANRKFIRPRDEFRTRLPHQESYLAMMMINDPDFF